MKFEYKKWFLENPQFPSYRKPNETSLWHFADTEELFKENLKKYPDSVHLQNYLKNPITYSYNNYGFRTPDDFNLDGEGNVYLGCSSTFGIGHHLEDTWPYKLSQSIGGKNYNIAEPGIGIMTQYRYLNYFKDKIKFKNVFHYLPTQSWARYEKIVDDKFTGVPVSGKISYDLVEFLYNDKMIHLVNYIFIDAIRYMLNEMNVNYYLVTKTGSLGELGHPDPYHKKYTPARDLIHYYVEEQSDVSKHFLYKYKNGLTDNTDNPFLLEENDVPNII